MAIANGTYDRTDQVQAQNAAIFDIVKNALASQFGAQVKKTVISESQAAAIVSDLNGGFWKNMTADKFVAKWAKILGGTDRAQSLWDSLAGKATKGLTSSQLKTAISSVMAADVLNPLSSQGAMQQQAQAQQ